MIFKTTVLLTLPCLGYSFQLNPVAKHHVPNVLSMTTDATRSGAGTKVTVIGGTGFVGSRVCKSLIENGVDVTSVSKSGKVPTLAWCDDSWTSQVKWIAADLESTDEAALDILVGSPDCLVSCMGVIGSDRDRLLKGNGDANCAAFSSARRGGKLQRAVYVSVSSEVIACEENWLPEFFKGYFDGKRMAENCALEAVGGDSSLICLVKPTFIYGGDAFGLLPPRVNEEYGSFIEELLSLGVIKFFANLSPGLIKVALRPPSSVDAVAEACVSATLAGPALGKVLEGAVEINGITNQPPATGLTDAIDFAKIKTGDFIEWAKEEVPKVVEKIEKMKK